jgi:molybdopterin converting factor small subunit
MDNTFVCTVELYGFPADTVPSRTVDIVLIDGAPIADVIGELKKVLPGLDGLAFRPGKNRLADLYKFNVNGHLYYDGDEFILHKGDKIALITLMTGG